jgi:hypothetical protein
MLTSKAFDKKGMIPKEKKRHREMKTFERIIFKNPLEARGLHPLGAPRAPNESSTPRGRRLTSKAYDKTKARLTSKKAQVEDKSDF